MTTERGSNQLLDDANRRLQKTEYLLNHGKLKRAKGNISASIAILNRVLVSLENSKKSKKKTGNNST